VIGHVLGVLPEDEEWFAGLPAGDEILESLDDFPPSLEDGVEWAQGGWSFDLELDPDPIVVLR
jgi:hypothetical protein